MAASKPEAEAQLAAEVSKLAAENEQVRKENEQLLKKNEQLRKELLRKNTDENDNALEKMVENDQLRNETEHMLQFFKEKVVGAEMRQCQTSGEAADGTRMLKFSEA